MEKEVQNNIADLTKKLIENGCSYDSVQLFIKDNLYFFVDEHPDCSKHIYFVYNHLILYGIIFVYGDSYTWSICKDGEFSRIYDSRIDEVDSIIETILKCADSSDFKKVVPDVSSMNLEEKVKALKKFKLNSYGYHFK